jgi:hypothetical protein
MAARDILLAEILPASAGPIRPLSCPPKVSWRVAQAFDLGWHRQHSGVPRPSRSWRRVGALRRKEPPGAMLRYHGRLTTPSACPHIVRLSWLS